MAEEWPKEDDLNVRSGEGRRAEADLADLRRKLELMTIVSPARGTVAKKNARPGEVVQRGQPIFMLVDASRFWVEANVEETEIRFVKPGSRVTIRVDSYPGRDSRGKWRNQMKPRFRNSPCSRRKNSPDSLLNPPSVCRLRSQWQIRTTC